MNRIKFTVAVEPKTTCTEFPLDMLRFDGLHPARSTDVYAIMNARDKTLPTVRLEGYHPKGWFPEAERWSSFGWEVKSVEGER